MKREVCIKRRGDTWFVYYVSRRKHQHYAAGQFYAADFSLDFVKEWIANKPDLILVQPTTKEKVLGHMNNKIAELEARLYNAERSAKRTADVASCLANGIQPD